MTEGEKQEVVWAKICHPKGELQEVSTISQANC